MSEDREYVWFDGRLVPSGDAKVSVKTHALHYGTAVFEGIRAYSHSGDLFVFRLKEHSERLTSSARMIHMSIPQTPIQVASGVLELLRKNAFKTSVYIRPIAFVGEGGINLDFRRHPKHVAIFAFPFSAYFEKSGLRVCISSWRRVSQASMIPRAKAAGNYLNSCMATIEAKLAGFDEALMLDEDGQVSEGPGENLFLVDGDVLSTPPPNTAILEGITRQTAITLARDMGYEVVERPIGRSELYTADEVFFTGTAAEIEPILEIDGRKVAHGEPGAVTKKLKAAYSNAVSGKTPKYKSWLTPVYGSRRQRARGA